MQYIIFTSGATMHYSLHFLSYFAHYTPVLKNLLVYNVELLLGFKELLEISIKEDYYVVRRFCIK